MNNRDFTLEVFAICEKAIVADQGFSEVYAKVCALVKAESAPKTPNSAMPLITCDNCHAPSEHFLCQKCLEEALKTSHSTMEALADRWCNSTNQPESVCVALYRFTKWARQQHQ
jgi:hypothetical protein